MERWMKDNVEQKKITKLCKARIIRIFFKINFTLAIIRIVDFDILKIQICTTVIGCADEYISATNM